MVHVVALIAVCSTHGCVQLCEDAKAVRVSLMDAPMYLPVCVYMCRLVLWLVAFCVTCGAG